MTVDDILYVFVNNLIVFVFVWFVHAFVPYKPKYQDKKNLTRATLLLYSALAVISLLRQLPGFNAHIIFFSLTGFYFIFQITFLLVVFDGSVGMKLLIFFVEKIIETLCMALAQNLCVLLIPDFMEHYIADDTIGGWSFLGAIALSTLFIWGVCWVGVKVIRYVQRRNARLDIMAYILIPASQFILFLITMFLYAGEVNTAFYNPYGVAALVLGALGDLALFVMIKRMSENAELRAQLEATKMQQSYYTLLEEQQKQIREMQHDINNHVAVIRSLTANAEDGTDLKQYAEELTAPKLLHLHYCRNTILNALLVNKAADCRKAGIEAEFDIHLAAGTEGYDDYDLVALVSNLLDNAIEAAGTAENKRLALTMHLADGALSILCRNSCGADGTGSYAANQGKMTRGNGRAIINRLVKKYSGELELRPEDGSYTVSVMLFARENAVKKDA